MKRDHPLPNILPMMIRNIVCTILVLCVAELNLSSGRHVKDVVIDQSDVVIDQTGVVVDPPDVVIDPPYVVVEPPVDVIEPSTVINDQPDVVIDQTDVRLNPPNVVIDQPDIVFDQPGVVFDQPDVVVEPPVVVIDPPDGINDQPDIVFDQPDIILNQPDVAIDQSDVMNDLPEIVMNHPNGELSFRDELPAPTRYDDSKAMNDNTISLSRKKRKATNKLNLRWPQKEIPYEIDYSQFNNDAVSLIFQAMNVWQQYTCLRFRLRNWYDKNYIRFMNGGGCTSNIGMIGGLQNVSLNTNECINLNFITHELGHAIGFFHEQNRPDRDQFITVFMENIKDNDRRWFEISHEIDTYGVPYDYTSLMHYTGIASSKNGKITMQTKDPSYQDIIGHANGLSFYDIQLANLMYKCNQKCPIPLRCQNFGFQGPDCRCWCRGNPIQYC